MTAEIVNLRAYRKAKQKLEKTRTASENRARFGREKAEQRRLEYERARLESQHEGNRLEGDASADDGSGEK